MQNSIFIRAALLCLFVVAYQLSSVSVSVSVSAFTVPRRTSSRSRSVPTTLQRPHGSSLQESAGGDNNESEKKESPSDPEEMQRDLNAMMAGGGSGGGSLEDQDEGPGLALYNTVPLLTGVIVTILSFALTGYGIYAGLTGDDPMAGHPGLPIS
jgi:hypothetical protein